MIPYVLCWYGSSSSTHRIKPLPRQDQRSLRPSPLPSNMVCFPLSYFSQVLLLNHANHSHLYVCKYSYYYIKWIFQCIKCLNHMYFELHLLRNHAFRNRVNNFKCKPRISRKKYFLFRNVLLFR